MQFPVAVPGPKCDGVAAPNFFYFWNFSVGCEWDRDPELEIEIGLLALPSGDGSGRPIGRRRMRVGDGCAGRVR